MTVATPKPPSIMEFAVGSSPPEEKQFSSGEKASQPRGVLYQGPWMTVGDGFSEHVRRCARALALTGCPVHLRSAGPQILYRDMPEHIGPLAMANIGSYSATIHQMVADAAGFHNLTSHPLRPPEETEHLNRFRVLSTVFERTNLASIMVDALHRVGQVWVACQANKKELLRLGLPEEKVRVVPIPFFDDDPLLPLRERERLPGPVRFYHIGKWEPRKNQDRIVLAFMRAFKPGEATLLMKLSAGAPQIKDYPAGVVAACHEAIEDPVAKENGWTPATFKRSIFHRSEKVPEQYIFELHRMGDIYVTLSSGEGFDMPAFDAKLAGNRLVYTEDSGGPADFADPRDYPIPSTGMRKCHPFYGWESNAEYLDFSIDQASAAMRDAAKDALSKPRQLALLNDFTARNVGTRMLGNLSDLLAPYDVKAY